MLINNNQTASLLIAVHVRPTVTHNRSIITAKLLATYRLHWLLSALVKMIVMGASICNYVNKSLIVLYFSCPAAREPDTSPLTSSTVLSSRGMKNWKRDLWNKSNISYLENQQALNILIHSKDLMTGILGSFCNDSVDIMSSFLLLEFSLLVLLVLTPD